MASAQLLTPKPDQQQEIVFLQQLVARDLFELAELHCRRQMVEATDTDEQAFWLIQLCQTFNQHTWWQDVDNRLAMNQQAVQLVEEFLSDRSSSLEMSCRLRIVQAESLVQKVRFQQLIESAGISMLARSETAGSQRPSKRKSSPLLDRSAGLMIGVVEEVESLRTEVPSVVWRQVRDHARFVLCTTYVVQIENAALTGEFKQLRETAERQFELLEKTATDRNILRAAQYWRARLMLVCRDWAMFDLLKGRLESEIVQVNYARRSLMSNTALLEAEAFLHRGQPSDAMSLLQSSTFTESLARQYGGYLQLRSLLTLLEYSDQLDDSKLSAELSAKFDDVRKTTGPQLRGVFRDAANHVVSRFLLVKDVGQRNAELIGNAADLVRDEKFDDADNVLTSILESDTIDRQAPSFGTVLLQHGEVLLKLQRWSVAIQQLTQAEKVFRAHDRNQQAAASDLLKIFALAQQFRHQTSSDQTEADEQRINDAQVQYREALERHLSEYAEQTTAATARKWLIQLLEVDEPLQAASLVLDDLKDKSHRDDRLQVLLQVGELLVGDRRIRSQSDASNGTSQFDLLASRFIDEVNALLRSERSLASLNHIKLAVLQLQVEVRPELDGSLGWSSIQQRVEQIEIYLSGQSQTANTELIASFPKQSVLALSALVLARLSADEEALNGIEMRIDDLNASEKLEVLKFLAPWYGSGKSVKPGDLKLAQLTDRVVRQLLGGSENATQNRLTQNDLLSLVPVAVRVFRVTLSAALLDAVLDQCVNDELSQEQLMIIAETLRPNAFNRPDAIRVVTKFWVKVNRSHESGTKQWLESSSQLIELEVQGNNLGSARRRIGVIESLYPDWGSHERKQRMTELRIMVEKSNASDREN